MKSLLAKKARASKWDIFFFFLGGGGGVYSFCEDTSERKPFFCIYTLICDCETPKTDISIFSPPPPPPFFVCVFVVVEDWDGNK